MPEFVAYRCIGHPSPFWDEPNPRAGRFNRAGEAPTTYLGLHPLTPWAELLRATGRRTIDEVRALRPLSWAARVAAEPADVVELSFDSAGDHGLVPHDLVADDYSACQAFAGRLRVDPDAPKIIVAPSAALPGTRSLILLGRRVTAPYDLDVNHDPAVDTPAAVTAALGSSLLSLVAAVRYRHARGSHAALAAWEDGEPYAFDEPAVTARELAVA
jgi:RES domain-containing protein